MRSKKAGGAATKSPASSKGAEVKITAAKGRPMLTWVGKRPLSHVTAFPAQLVERHDAFGIVGLPHHDPKTGSPQMAFLRALRAGWNGDCWNQAPGVAVPEYGGLLYHGDNKEVLAHLLASGYRGKVNLIYIDPPFDSGADYVRKVSLRGPKGTAKLDGESYALGEQIQYTDIWANDNYLQFMYERLLILKELLAENGSVFIHCDWRRAYHLRCLLDEVFTADNFVNEIIWLHQIMGGAHDKRFPKAHETLLWYAKGKGYRIRSDDPRVRIPFGEYVRDTMKQDDDGRWYYERRRMSRKATPDEAASKAHTRTYVECPEDGTVASDVWTDMLSYQEVPSERLGLELYPTQKTVDLLERVVAAASDPGDLVLDCFIGSGTTAAVAQKLGRRWIGCDINKGAIQTTTKRLEAIVRPQIEAALAAAKNGKQKKLIESEKEAVEAKPAQFGFMVGRVNDYDLQIQHNEAVNLACEHIGVERTRADTYFDGTRGKSLVKIIPFGHPLSPLDLEEVKRELEARPEEDRNITLVCLGMEMASATWIEEWNRLRKGKNAVNKLEVIELRTDPKYGKFIQHEPARARVKVTRKADTLRVEIVDFISPTIIERLKQQEALLAPKIEDWRAMVDCIMIDSAFDGKTFNVSLSDVPEKKTDFVSGIYEIPAPKGKTTVAVRITDMLGEEVIIAEIV